MSDIFDGMRPSAPPPELRGRVLAAAREAASERAPGLLELLIDDRAVRVSFAVVAVLLVGYLFSGRVPTTRSEPVRPVVADEGNPPGETGLTASEQIPELEPAL